MTEYRVILLTANFSIWVEGNAAGVEGMELDCGLVNKTTKEHVPAECSQARTVEGGAHISDWDLRLET